MNEKKSFLIALAILIVVGSGALIVFKTARGTSSSTSISEPPKPIVATFSSIDSFNYSLNNSGTVATITGLSPTAKSQIDSKLDTGNYHYIIVIPKKKGDIPIEEIGDKAFSESTGLIEVRIAENIKKIGADAFLNCSGLATVKVPTNMEVKFGGLIKKDVFTGCSLSIDSQSALRQLGYKGKF